MGLFDSLKKAIGGGPKTETVKGPTATLRDHGIDTSGLDIDISSQGGITVSGRVASQAQCDQICEVLEDMPNVKGVVNNMTVGAPAPEPQASEAPAPEPQASEAPAPEATSAPAAEGAGRTYTVQSGDTLWKISQEMYDDGSKYMKIFEANTGLLEDPNKIFPGQELVIPDLDD